MAMQMQMDLLPPSAAERALAAAMERHQRARLTAWRRAQKAAKCDGRGHHANSLAAHEGVAQRARGRRGEILGWLEAHGAATDREVMQGLGFTDMNAVRPRITELLGMGAVREIGRVRDEVTGMMVRRVEIV